MNSMIENITCECGTVFQWVPNDEHEIHFLDIFRPKRCQPCNDRLKVEREEREAIKAAEREKDRQEWIARNKIEITEKITDSTPALFLRTDITHPKFNAAAWGKIENHRMTEELPWIGFVGMTGRCKSRMAYLYAAELLKRITDNRVPSFDFVASYEIGDAVVRQYGGDFQEKYKARRYLDRLREVDVLLIDDLGKGRLPPTVASELFALVNHRHVNQSMTIWTSNSTPEAIAAGLPEDIAGPFAGRILESSKIFTFK